MQLILCLVRVTHLHTAVNYLCIIPVHVVGASYSFSDPVISNLMSGSQNQTVLPKQHVKSFFFFLQLTQIKAMLMLLWPLLITNLIILGLILRGTTYFVLESYLATLDKLCVSCCFSPRLRDDPKLEPWTQNVPQLSLFTN